MSAPVVMTVKHLIVLIGYSQEVLKILCGLICFIDRYDVLFSGINESAVGLHD